MEKMNPQQLHAEYMKNPTFEKFQELMNNPTTFRNFQFNLTPEKLNLTPLEFHKIKEKMGKISNFWENNLPKGFSFLIFHDYYISESAVLVGSEFSTGGIYEKEDYKNFPWIKKILKKRKEVFGF